MGSGCSVVVSTNFHIKTDMYNIGNGGREHPSHSDSSCLLEYGFREIKVVIEDINVKQL